MNYVLVVCVVAIILQVVGSTSRRLSDITPSTFMNDGENLNEPLVPDSSLAMNNCQICSNLVYERTIENRTVPDHNTVEAFSCGHFPQVHNECLIRYVLASADRLSIGCPVCDYELTVNSVLAAEIEKKKTELYLSKHASIPDDQGFTILDVVEKWQYIWEVGNAIIPCTESIQLSVLQCAYFVLQNPNVPQLLSKFIEEYNQNPIRKVNKLIRSARENAIHFKNAKVFSYYGRLITLRDARRLSFNSATGGAVYKALEDKQAEMDAVIQNEVSHPILNLPEIWNIKFEPLFIHGIDMGICIEEATQLMQVSLLDTKFLIDGVRAVNEAFVTAENDVDTYIQQNWPSLVELKHISMLGSTRQNHYTIRYMAKVVYSQILPSIQYRELLDQYEEGAAATLQKLNSFETLSYQGMQYLKNYQLKHAPGGAISIYMAILFTLHPSLPQMDCLFWKAAINKAFLSILLSLRPPLSRVAVTDGNSYKKQRMRKTISHMHETFNDAVALNFFPLQNYRQRRFATDSSVTPLSELRLDRQT